jgi:hypothetical protein
MAIVLLGLLNLLALWPLASLPREPAEHDAEQSVAAVTPEYAYLLRAARVLLPLSYVLNAAVSPVMPYLLTSLKMDLIWRTPCTATWMFARVAVMAIMWRVPFWHGRWGTLVAGSLAMSGGFALIVSAWSVPLMLAGLVLYGSGMGIVYYAALYYAMSVGRAQVDAGGTHEALIGLGYTLGPIAGFAGYGLAGFLSRSGSAVQPEFAVIGVVWGLVAVGAVGAVRPYLLARRRRLPAPTRGAAGP